MEVKLIRACVYGRKIDRVIVPRELEPFVNYMFSRGYAETTIAMMVRDLQLIMKRGLTERDLELMTGKKACKLRNAWRHYKTSQKLNEGCDKNASPS